MNFKSPKLLWTIIASTCIAFLVSIYENKVTKKTTTQVFIKNKTQPPKKKTIYKTVHIAGAVNTPGIYHISQNIRVFEILEIAGGITPAANLDKINLAAKIKDGKRIFIPFKKPTPLPKKKLEKYFHKMTVNELQNLSGVGKIKAIKLKTYREENGPIRDLLKLSKIKGISKSQVESWIKYEELKP